jgi:hypothetical protein
VVKNEKTNVYELSHAYEDEEESEHYEIIGLFSTKRAARIALEQVKNNSRFDGRFNDFYITKVEIDAVSWSSGFVSFEEALQGSKRDEI